MKISSLIIVHLIVLAPLRGLAGDGVTINLLSASGVGESAGQITITESAYGLVFTPALNGLSPGLHGFHVHQNPDCSAMKKGDKMVAGLAAGGHYDPNNAGRHGSPWGDGHLGDLPPLFVAPDGSATQPVLASRLKMDDIKGRSLMLHAGGDNHSDQPARLGGGGARMACGTLR